jgi:hypothetical protein
MKTTTVKTRIDYSQLAAQLNYTELDRKLDQLRVQEAPKKSANRSAILWHQSRLACGNCMPKVGPTIIWPRN